MAFIIEVVVSTNQPQLFGFGFSDAFNLCATDDIKRPTELSINSAATKVFWWNLLSRTLWRCRSNSLLLSFGITVVGGNRG